MNASTPTSVPLGLDQLGLMLKDRGDRSTAEVKDYTVQYEDQLHIVEALGDARTEPENRAIVDLLNLRESRLDAARDREATFTAAFSNYCIAEKTTLQAQANATAALASAAAAASSATNASAGTTTPTPTVAEKKVMKRKLPEPRDGWKDSAGKTHKAHLDAMTYHKTMSIIFWQMMDIVHGQSTSSGTVATPAPDVLLARLVPFDTMEENIHTYSVLELITMGLNCVHEAAHSVYIKHVYNGTVAETFFGRRTVWGRPYSSN